MDKINRAQMVAERAHATQQYDIYPYMFHINQVLNISQQLGYDESIQVACILHDTLEDSDLSYNDIKKNFGESIAEIVYAVTDELGRDRKERKLRTYHKIRANWKATVVKICDRIANVEHSKKYNKGMYDMYIKENMDFISNVYSGDNNSDIKRALARLLEIID